MSYRILPTKEFANDFLKLDDEMKSRVRKKVEETAHRPERYTHLSSALKGSSRLRVGKLRILFSYDEHRNELYLEKIVFGHRYDDHAP